MIRAIVLTLWVGTLLTSASPDKPPKAKKTSAHTASQKTTKRSKSARRRKPPAPSYQLHPDPDRYRQIQQALADRGYFKGQPDGNWTDDSTDALKRFQTDQKLEPDGKISALTLTGLGLGPRHDGSSANTVPLSAANSGASNAAEPPPISEVPTNADPQR
ncbi:MAG TPA: peptidoglycan-binding domain-containing protein [Bryobacteraceae bacterium]|jgi:peptidoglycan hydrolase-like protein with peptidoglycan-binding domain